MDETWGENNIVALLKSETKKYIGKFYTNGYAGFVVLYDKNGDLAIIERVS
jgi:hypothetical protein